MREKLIELLKESGVAFPISTANFLIANGVTIATDNNKWIPFDDVKPQDGQSVLCVTTEGEMEVHYLDANWQNCLCQYGGNVKTFNITHWMPLPTPPKGEEQ